MVSRWWRLWNLNLFIRLYSKPAQRCCNFAPVHCSGAKFWNSVNRCRSAPEQNHCSRANFWNGVISECCNSVALHCSGAKLLSWRPNFLEWCQQLQTALEQNNCSGVKFRNSVSDFCSGAVHCNCTATPLQHLCAGLEYSLIAQIFLYSYFPIQWDNVRLRYLEKVSAVESLMMAKSLLVVELS